MKKSREYNSLILLNSSLVFLTLISCCILSSSIILAETVSRTATVRVADACSLYVDDITTHTATLMNGIYSGSTSEYANGIGSTTLLASCNDSGGFKIYAVGYTDNEYGQTNLTSSFGSTIATGTATSGDTSNWAMKLTANTGANLDTITLASGYNAFHSVPSTYAEVASRNSATTTSNGASITTTYATYISLTQPSGAYTGQVKYTLVHPTTEVPLQPQVTEAGCIRYYPNSSNVVGTMGCQSIASSDTYATLLASNFSRSNYGFAGWSDTYDYETNQNAHFYGPQEDITFTAGQYTGQNPGLSLYAVWVKSQGPLQDSTKVYQICSNLTTAPTDGTANLSSVSALTDLRDNETYAIAKLADTNCWMIENLRLEAENTRGEVKQNLAQGYGTSATYGSFKGLADAESTGFISTTYSSNSLYSDDGSNNTINIGTNSAASRMPRFNNWNHQTLSINRPQNPTYNAAINSTSKAGMYSYGNYYTWHAAIANLIYNNTNNNSVTSTSLCPTGWHLPTGGKAYASGDPSGVNITGTPSTYREFYNLGYKIMNEVKTAYEDFPANGNSYYYNTTNTNGDTASKAFRKFPNNFLYSGFFYNSSAANRGQSEGRYWSSTASSYYLHIGSHQVDPGTQSSIKSYGMSIRCIASRTAPN